MTGAALLAICGAVGLALTAGAILWREKLERAGARLAATGVGWALFLASLLVFDFSIPSLVNSYVWQILIKVGIYVTLAVSLNVINGIAGQFSMGHAGFMAIGGYTAAYLTMTLGSASSGWWRWLPWNQPWSAVAGSGLVAGLPWGLGHHLVFLVSLVAGGTAAAIAGYLVGIPSLRLKGDYLAIVTLGFGEIIRNLIANVQIIGASRGLPGVPHYSNIFWVFSFAGLAVFVSYRLLASAPGRAMLAVREDEVAAAAVGIDTTRTKIQAFMIGTFFAGAAGALLGHHQEYLHPDYFKFDKSFEVIIMVVLGGMGSVSGAVVAGVILAIAPEALRYVKDLLGNLTEPAVLYVAAPLILFSAAWLVLYAIDLGRLLTAASARLVTALRMRLGRIPARSEIARLREGTEWHATSILPALGGLSRPARDAGLGMFAGLAVGALHRAFVSVWWNPRVEYVVLVIAGAAIGIGVGAWRARGRVARSDSAALPADTKAALGWPRLATLGLLIVPAFALSAAMEAGAPAALGRMSVFFQGFPDPRMVLYSLMLIILMLTRPSGLFGTKEIRTWWRERRQAARARVAAADGSAP